MKKTLTIGGLPLHAVKKALLIMKLTVLLVLVGVLQVSATVNGQTKVSLTLSQVEIGKVLSHIEMMLERRKGLGRCNSPRARSTIRRDVSASEHSAELSSRDRTRR